MKALPFAWHIEEIMVLIIMAIGHSMMKPNARQKIQGRSALIILLVVTVWPVGDLAAYVSLTVATLQRLVIMLLVAPLLLLSVPTSVYSRLTKPRLVDALVRRVTHPGVALVLVLVIGTATLTSPVVDAGAHSQLARDLTLLVVLFTGTVLWAPALGVVVGGRQLSAAARGGYLIAASLVVTSLSFVWIFARHPLYPALHHQRQLVGMSALFDQQLAGFLAKLLCYIPLWIVAFNIFFNADSKGIAVEDTPLHWADVERQLLRIDRQRERTLRRYKPE
jgi:cytochrome c oxidase assembly factor CtaG